jgi:hypothetical protein
MAFVIGNRFSVPAFVDSSRRMTRLDFYVNERVSLVAVEFFLLALLHFSVLTCLIGDSVFGWCATKSNDFPFPSVLLAQSTEPEGSHHDTGLQLPQRGLADLRDVAIEQQQHRDERRDFHG